MEPPQRDLGVLGTGAQARLPEMDRKSRPEQCVIIGSSKFHSEVSADSPSALGPTLNSLTSDQVGIRAELKHINKRRKRNQQGYPQ